MNYDGNLSIEKKYQFVSSEKDVSFLFNIFYSLALEKNIFISGGSLSYKIKSIKYLCLLSLTHPEEYAGIINRCNGSCFLMKRQEDKGYVIFCGINNKNPFSAKKDFFAYLKLVNEKFGIKKFYSDASPRNDYDKFIFFLEKCVGFKKTGRGGDENYELIYE